MSHQRNGPKVWVIVSSAILAILVSGLISATIAWGVFRGVRRATTSLASATSDRPTKCELRTFSVSVPADWELLSSEFKDTQAEQQAIFVRTREAIAKNPDPSHPTQVVIMKSAVRRSDKEITSHLKKQGATRIEQLPDRLSGKQATLFRFRRSDPGGSTKFVGRMWALRTGASEFVAITWTTGSEEGEHQDSAEAIVRSLEIK
jgi:hypothetical protein